MDPRTQERVEQWDSRPFSGGFDDLSTLADSDFSGAVAAGGAWLFMLNGRVVGTVDGEITDFEDASGTVYRAPDPSLPLLSVMEERGGNVQAQYYTNETPLREVDQTLQDGSFTGYIELSENVLSGDYYAVYYGGRRMAAAYIGNAERLLTGDEAFERADDEVGIYKVFNVDIDVTDIPGTSATAGTQADTAETSSGADASDSAGVDTGIDNATDASDTATDSATRAEPSVDPTESAIDQLDVSGTGGRTGTGTGAEAGTSAGPETDVTADEDTDQTLTTDLTPESGTDTDAGTSTSTSTGADTDTDAESNTQPRSTPESGITTEDSSSIVDDESDVPAGITAPTESETDESTEQTEPVVGSTTGADTGETPADESQSGLSSTPDPETVEAAAEELDQSDISWIEDDADDADTAGTPEATPAPPAPDHAGSGSESMTAADESAERDTDSGTGAGAGSDADADKGENEHEHEGEAEGEAEGELDQQLEAEEAWRETRSIPSIDPDNSAAGDSSRAAPSRAANGRSRSGAQSGTESASGASAGAAGSGSGSSSSPDSRSTSSTDSHNGQAAQAESARSQPASDQRNREQSADANRNGTANGGDDAHKRNLAQYTQRIEELEQKHNALAEKARELKSERDELRAENQQLTSTVDSLRTQISELESELEQARAGDGGGGGGGAQSGSGFDAETHLSPTEALSGTNLFVRYDSKSQPTLETAHDGAADRNEVASNLRLEHHTEFEADSVAVDGQPYETYLQETIEYTFVDWLTEMVLYEIRDTGNADGLADLYDAIPRIDRAELGATISLADDDTEDVPDEVTFDVVAFDKMGNPLILATLNDSREPASQELLEELEVAASAVKANYPDLAAAVAVTSSYFEPGALEVTEQATSSGFLSRGSKLSYVNLSRKSGYHLCLVESRSEGFHMNVPEL
ncbi:DUF7527 domain-containing protein [Natrialba sp. SSL1]|uniref:DUF7527 domain-containing protein n=1 Tax=Natrialba sp. SSL1 TaxID=1869245 RepID=UPI0008F839CE|nr:transcriptional regulator [Natrialba sp. SSL1]OIB57007.1 transcriptional regulator [Natrialba sp. SSL1]